MEGLEQMLPDGWDHTDAGVGEGDADGGSASFRIAHAVNPNDQASALRHGVDAISNQVHKNLTQFAFQTEYGGAGLIPSLYRDVGEGQASAIKIDGRVQHAGYILFRRRHGMPIEAESLGGDGRDSSQLALGILQKLDAFRIPYMAVEKIK